MLHHVIHVKFKIIELFALFMALRQWIVELWTLDSGLLDYWTMINDKVSKNTPDARKGCLSFLVVCACEPIRNVFYRGEHGPHEAT